MNRLTAWLINGVSRALGPDEREVLLGDLAESHASSGRALWDILDLAVRRQIIAWGAWQPWFTLVCVVVPVGMLLALVSRFWADETASTIRLFMTHGGPLF